MKRAVLYARVSSDDSKKETRNLRTQIQEGREYCQEKGYRIIDELPEDEKGVSGADLDAPKLKLALEMARAGQIDVFVCREIDRLGRDTYKMYLTERQFKQYGVRVEYYKYQFPDTPYGEFIKGQYILLAQLERDLIAERTTRARKKKVKDGSVLCHGNPPFGYRIEKTEAKTSLVINEEEAAIVRKVFELYVGEDKPSICRVAERMTGTPTCADLRRNPSNPKKRGWGEWSPASVSSILSKPVYSGIWTYANDPDLAVQVPTIVSLDVWERAQERKSHNSKFSKRNGKYEYLLAKRLKCSCGSSMTCRSSTWKDTRYYYYHCNARLYATECDASKFWRADEVDKAVWDWLTDLFSDPEEVTGLVAKFIEEQEKDKQDLIDKVNCARNLRDEKHEKMRRLLDNFLDDPKLDKEWFYETKGRLEKELEDLDYYIRDLEFPLWHWESYKEYYEQELCGDPEGFGRFVVSMGLGTSSNAEIIDKLDVTATLIEENGEERIHVRCNLGEKALPFGTKNLRTL